MDDPSAEKKPMKPTHLHERFSYSGDMPIPGDIVKSVTSDSSQGRAWLEFHSGRTIEIDTGTNKTRRPSFDFVGLAIVLMWAVSMAVFFFKSS
jgi:hypothetical protein